MIGKKQIPVRFQKIIDQELSIFNAPQSVKSSKKTPAARNILSGKQASWDSIPLVICVFVDMLGSTKMSAELRNKTFARAYLFYVETALRLFDKFNPVYINVHGDGIFAIFDKDFLHTALAAAITFKTFSEEVYTPIISKNLGKKSGAHIGIDEGTVILGRVPLKEHQSSVRLNEIWAGTPVNMAAKLAALSKNNEILVSDRYHIRMKKGFSKCLCKDYNAEKIWTKKDYSNNKSFDFNFAYGSVMKWCKDHGSISCGQLLALDKSKG